MLVVGGMALILVISLGVSIVGVFRPWLRVKMAGGDISLPQIIAMRLRNTPIELVVETYLVLLYQGEPVSITEIETCYLAHPGISDRNDLVRHLEGERDADHRS